MDSYSIKKRLSSDAEESAEPLSSISELETEFESLLTSIVSLSKQSVFWMLLSNFTLAFLLADE